MTIINAGSNSVVSGVRVPVGSYEWPEHGGISVVTAASSNFVTVGTGDFLLIDDAGSYVRSGVDVYQAVLLGTLLTVGYLGLLVMARRIASFISGRRVKEV